MAGQMPERNGDAQEPSQGVPSGEPAFAEPNPSQSGSAAPAEPAKHKPHHSYIWLGSLRALPALILAVFVSGWSGIAELADALGSGEAGFSALGLALGLVAVALVALVALAMGIMAVSYHYVWYEFGEAEFSYYCGVLSKKRVHVPYQKVQSVNEKASLLQRLAGVCTVSIDTAGGSSNKAVVIPYVKRSSAERIRQELFYRKRLMDSGLSPADADAQVRALQARQAAAAQVLQPTAAWAGAPVPPQPGAAPFPPREGAPVPPAGYVAPVAPPSQPTAWQQPAAPASAQSAPAAWPQPAAVQPAPAAWQQPGQAAQPATWPQPAAAQPDPLAAAVGPDGNLLDLPAGMFDDMRGAFGGQEVDTGAVSYEFGLSNKELILSAITGKSSFALVLVGVVTALASGLSTLIDVNLLPSDDGFYSMVWGVVGAGGPWLWAAIASGILGILLFLWLLSVVGACLSYGGFRARRRGERVEVERGIVSHEFTGIEIDRIQSINVTQTLFQRLLRCCSLSYGRIDAADADSSDQSLSTSSLESALVVHPFLPRSRVPEVLAGLTPEYADLPEADRRVSPKALRRGITRRTVLQGSGFWLAVVALLAYALVMVLAGDVFDKFDLVLLHTALAAVIVLAAVIFAFEVLGAVLWYRRAAFGFDGRYLAVVNGGYSVETVVLPRQKIQLAHVRTNPLQRHAHTATLIAVSAAGIGGKKERLVDVSETDAREWLMWARPHQRPKV